MNSDQLKSLLEKRKEWEIDVILKSLQDEDFKKHLARDPHGALSEHFQQEIPESIKINVVEEQPGEVTIVLPVKPTAANSSEDLTEQELDKVAGGVGVAAGVSSENLVAVTVI